MCVCVCVCVCVLCVCVCVCVLLLLLVCVCVCVCATTSGLHRLAFCAGGRGGEVSATEQGQAEVERPMLQTS